MFNYKIPYEIKSVIPDYFYYALGGEYVSVAGADALIRNEDGLTRLDYDTGTAGYVEAFKAACKKLGMQWLLAYYEGLSWYESDLFDSEIADEVMHRFDHRSDIGTTYYQYLLDSHSSDPQQKTDGCWFCENWDKKSDALKPGDAVIDTPPMYTYIGDGEEHLAPLLFCPVCGRKLPTIKEEPNG